MFSFEGMLPPINIKVAKSIHAASTLRLMQFCQHAAKKCCFGASTKL